MICICDYCGGTGRVYDNFSRLMKCPLCFGLGREGVDFAKDKAEIFLNDYKKLCAEYKLALVPARQGVHDSMTVVELDKDVEEFNSRIN